MIVCLAVTRNWYIYQVINLYALFKHNNVKKVYMFIEDDNIPYITDERVEFINTNNVEEYIKKDSPNYKTHYTKMTFVRCYLSKVLKEDKILYIDADALVVDNIEDLWNIDLEDNLIVGVHEGGEWDKHLNLKGFDDTYINTGILLMDLKKIREQKLDDKMLEILNTKYYFLPDQDVINIVFQNKIKRVDNRYNSTETTGFRDDAKIIHYIRDSKGWVKTSPRSEIWYNYHNEYLKGEGKMDNYFVRATRNFDDNEHNGTKRIKGQSEWWCSAERYEFLKANNAVELIEIKKIEEPKIEAKEEIIEEVKPKKKTTKKKKVQ